MIIFSMLIDSLEVLQKFSSRLMEYCSSDGEEASIGQGHLRKAGDVIVFA